MLETLRKIVQTGIVTEKWDKGNTPARFRGGVTVKAESCRKCGICAKVCPAGAIDEADGLPFVDSDKCIFCGRCQQFCETGAIYHTADYKLAHKAEVEQLGTALSKKITRILGRSLAIRHVDVGSCNACDWEMVALGNPLYDLSQYGINFVASPRHADLLMVTGMVTRNLTKALLETYKATPNPKLVVAVGSCAAGGQTFGKSYAIRGGADALVPVDVYIPGCPPRPQALIHGLLLAVDRL
ncbi:MAG: NADH-quinone oxidoreductase subunit NuoB [Veillonellaceae bacterium]|jgi:Ni,Fe-hydrogenase III small subunit/NAD-dependent dihydropyrimidine dehydrogenase PreA subunit|nr:NADH-quinone oxidoreductase subunit NuoB [Mollicutes bacterium]NLP40679.1 NADH-quinone oxidoreductase subunit NuoB [Veillonellaceae bacterium]